MAPVCWRRGSELGARWLSARCTHCRTGSTGPSTLPEGQCGASNASRRPWPWLLLTRPNGGGGQAYGTAASTTCHSRRETRCSCQPPAARRGSSWSNTQLRHADPRYLPTCRRRMGPPVRAPLGPTLRPHAAPPHAALAIGFGAYTYETFVLAKEGGKPIQAEITRHPDITSLRWEPAPAGRRPRGGER